MFGSNRAMIDNWSLELVGSLIDFDQKKLVILDDTTDEEFVDSFGALTNLINSIIFYDEVRYIENDLQGTWMRFNSFKNKITRAVAPIVLTDTQKLFYKKENDLGVSYYLALSKIFESDVFLSPARSTFISESYKKNSAVARTAIDLINMADDKVQEEARKLNSENIRVGVLNNFVLPSMLHYVMAEASSKDDLIDVAIQLSRSSSVANFKSIINDSLTGDGANFIGLENSIRSAVNQELGLEKEFDNKDWSISVTLFIFSMGKSFGFSKKENYLTFIKDIASYRSGFNNLNMHLERLFKLRITTN